ncbi:MAG: hypothetical protein JXX28_05520 [Deltaproteobacteria bacterium]|nr:hypothetical protein [Deltaproteobacteria bacterium]
MSTRAPSLRDRWHQGISTAPLSELLDIYGEANPATWITTETGLWWQQGAHPAARLQRAAEDHGYLAWWHLYGNMNGVHTDPVLGAD